MANDQLDDFDFLTELIRQIDHSPASDISARDVVTALGQPDLDAEPMVRRLKNRGFIDWSPSPARLSDGWNTRPLAVTPDGYRFDDTGLR